MNLRLFAVMSDRKNSLKGSIPNGSLPVAPQRDRVVSKNSIEARQCRVRPRVGGHLGLLVANSQLRREHPERTRIAGDPARISIPARRVPSGTPIPWHSIGPYVARLGLAQEHPSHTRQAAMGV